MEKRCKKYECKRKISQFWGVHSIREKNNADLWIGYPIRKESDGVCAQGGSAVNARCFLERPNFISSIGYVKENNIPKSFMYIAFNLAF